MTSDSDRELDARLAAAAGFRDEDLPALPDFLLRQIQADDLTESAAVTAEEPASVIAARQLVTDARQERSHQRRRSGRQRMLRRGVPLLAVAAIGVTALVVATISGGPTTPGGNAGAGPTSTASTTAGATGGPPADLGPLEAPPGGLALAATSDISFPYSLTSAPPGLTPVLNYSGPLTLLGYENPAVWSARYSSADDAGFTFRVSPIDPRILPPGAEESIDAQTTESEIAVGGVQGDLVLGDYDNPSCGYAPSRPEQTDTPVEVCAESFGQLTWQRPDGMWMQVYGEDDWSSAAAVVAIGESIVDVPQAVPLQVRLAPAGWSVSAYEDNRSLTLISDADPTISNRIYIGLSERWRGETTAELQESETQGRPVEDVTVNGEPGQLASVPNPLGFEDGSTDQWSLVYELPGGLVVGFSAPETLTHDQVLQIAAQVVYTP